MKYDALVSQGVDIVERVPIPDDMVPADAHVELAAKKAAGYYTPEPPKPQDLTELGRPLSRQVLSLHSHSSARSETAAALSLLSAAAVRERAQRMLALGLDDKLPHFRVDLAQLPKAVDLVLEITRKNYPALDVPFHSRWRHFVWNGEDRWAALDRKTQWPERRGARPRGVRSGDCQCVARCRRRTAMAVSRSRDRAEYRPLRGLGTRKPRDVCRRRFFVRPEKSAAGRCPRAGAAFRRHARARLSGHGIQSAGRGRRPRRSAAPARHADRKQAGRLWPQ